MRLSLGIVNPHSSSVVCNNSRVSVLVGDAILREQFLQHLPSSVHVVSAPTVADINSLADMADQIIEIAAPSVAAIHAPLTPSAAAHPPPTPSAAAGMDSLRSEVSHLQELVKPLSICPCKPGS